MENSAAVIAPREDRNVSEQSFPAPPLTCLEGVVANGDVHRIHLLLVLDGNPLLVQVQDDANGHGLWSHKVLRRLEPVPGPELSVHPCPVNQFELEPERYGISELRVLKQLQGEIHDVPGVQLVRCFPVDHLDRTKLGPA